MESTILDGITPYLWSRGVSWCLVTEISAFLWERSLLLLHVCVYWFTVDVARCTYNLVLCHSDETGCRLYAARMIDACAWNISGGHCVDVVRCRHAVRRFYTAHAPNDKRFRSLLFCRCEQGDQLCTSVRQAFHPACTAIQLPPPSCHDVINTCNEDADCR